MAGACWFVSMEVHTRTKREAADAWRFARSQSDFVGGRVVPPNRKDSHYLVQAFFPTNGEAPRGWLPDELHHRIVLDSQRRRLHMPPGVCPGRQPRE